MTAKKRVLFSFALVAIVLALAVLPSSQASAFDLSLNAKPIWTQASPSWQFCALGQQNTGTTGENFGGCVVGGDITNYFWQTSELDAYTYCFNGGVDRVRALRFFMPMTIPANTFVETSISLNQAENSNASDIMVADFKVLSTPPLRVVSQEWEMLNQSTARVNLILLAENTVNQGDPVILGSSFCNNLAGCIQNAIWFRETKTQVRGNGLTLYTMVGDGSQAIVDAINNNNSTSAVNSAKDAIVGAINEQKQAQAQANSDANDRYNDEKNTINDSKDEAEASANSMDTSGFNISNPFLNWLGLFTDDVCVSIPTMKSWLHSTESNICSPWKNTPVRSVLTPIFSLLGTMLVCGFVFRWLRSNNTEGTIEGI